MVEKSNNECLLNVRMYFMQAFIKSSNKLATLIDLI
jgi:hypothetical protein